MGAFDGLNFYQSTWRDTQQEEPSVRSEPRTYYVSWDGHNGGATGKHFQTKEEAVIVYNEKLTAGLHPACWFKTED